MCPFCFASMGLLIAGTVSTGGLAALAINSVSQKGARQKQKSLATRMEGKIQMPRRTIDYLEGVPEEHLSTSNSTMKSLSSLIA